MIIKEALTFGERALQNKSDAPRLDAERLLSQALNQEESSWLYAHSEDQLTLDQDKVFKANITRRASGEPLAYIFGMQEFYGRTFLVNKHILIPRPSTEELIEQSLAIIHSLYKKLFHPLVLADIGTGSGCIAITLALEAPQEISRILATDISKAALEVAQENIKRHGVEKVITTVQGNILEPLIDQPIDLIISNPPYVPSIEISHIDANNPNTAGLRFEPKNALDGGHDGQDYLKKIMASGVPAVMEGVGGKIITANID